MVFGRMLFVAIMCGFSGLYAAQTSVPTMPASVMLNFSNGTNVKVSTNFVRKFNKLNELLKSTSSEIKVETDLDITEITVAMLTQLVNNFKTFSTEVPSYKKDDKHKELTTVLAFAQAFEVKRDCGGRSINLGRLADLIGK